MRHCGAALCMMVNLAINVCKQVTLTYTTTLTPSSDIQILLARWKPFAITASSQVIFIRKGVLHALSYNLLSGNCISLYDHGLRAARLNGHVAFVGDGLNDSEALAAADVGFAMHTGVTSAVLLSDAVVTTSALRPIVAAFAGARATQDAVRTNMRRAFTYNILAVVAASFGLINPLIAAILMPLSSAWMVWGAMSVDRRITHLEDTWT